MNEIPESMEVVIEDRRRAAADMSDYQLDVFYAVASARRDVATAYGLAETAAIHDEVARAYDFVRTCRAQVIREIDSMTFPEETSESEPPC